MSKVKTHKEPAPSFIIRCFQFNTYNQKVGESIVEYIAICARQLNTVSNYCKLLSEMIRNRLVCGITITKVQKWLLAKKQLSLDEIVSLAQSKEVAEQGAKYLQMVATAKSTTNHVADLLKINAGASNKHDDKVHTSLNPVIIVVGNIHLTFVASNLNVVTFVVKLGT